MEGALSVHGGLGSVMSVAVLVLAGSVVLVAGAGTTRARAATTRARAATTRARAATTRVRAGTTRARSARARAANTRTRAATTRTHAKPAPLSIRIVGNHFVNGEGETVRLLGVDRPGTEYACEQGWGDSDGDTAADAGLIASWHVNAVRIPLNEDCWLGINGEPSYGTVESYRRTVVDYVNDLNSRGIYAILDLHWSAPDADVADGQRPMPDEHSIGFWSSVAGTFKRNHAVVFDLFNEPLSPAAKWQDESAYPVSWGCWLDGGCLVTAANVDAGGLDGDPGPDPATYPAVGMQALVNAIRGAGAPQVIMVGGLGYANDLSQWLEHEPSDPGPHGHRGRYPQIAASFHNYNPGANDTVARWNAMIAPIASRVPVVTGEFGENPCTATNDRWDYKFMKWADKHGVSYLGWGWYRLSAHTTLDCQSYPLLTASAKPSAPNGVALHAHLASLAAKAAKAAKARSNSFRSLGLQPSHA